MDVSRILYVANLKCDRPDPNRPGEDHFMMALRAAAQELHNRLQVALPGWDISYADVQAGPGMSLKNLQIPSLGKPRRCYAILDPSDEYALSCPVKIIDPDELNLYQGSASVAEVVAPFYKDGQWKAQFNPPLTASYTYRLWYEVGELPWYGRGDTPVPQIDSYHYLLADLMAVELLPHCWWSRLLGKEVEMKVSDQKKLMDAHAAKLTDRSEKSLARQFPVLQEHISTLLASQEPFANGYLDQCGDFDDHRFF